MNIENPQTFQLSVYNPEKVLIKDLTAKSLSVKGVAGELQILPLHADFITALAPGPLKVETLNDGDKVIEAQGGGFLRVEGSRVNLLLIQ